MDTSQFSVWKDVIIPLSAAFIGALIGGFFTLMGVNKAHKLDLIRQELDKKSQIKSFLQMIKAEIKTVWERYDSSVGMQLESVPVNQPFLSIFPVSNNYFTVYENNTSILGKIPEEVLREKIVKTYVLAKGLLDSYKMNNEMVNTYAINKFNSEKFQDLYLRPLAAQQLAALSQYADALKTRHLELKQSVNDLIDELNRTLS